MRQAPTTPVTPGRDNPLSVAQINARLKQHIESLGAVWAEGELTQWRQNKANHYGKLRDLDTSASLSVALWGKAELGKQFKDGDKVLVKIEPSYWMDGGSLSFVIRDIEVKGLGSLLQQLHALQAKIVQEGLTAAERKKPLPFLPNMIGLITSKGSDAERDVITNAQRRWPGVRFRVAHSSVQGDRAVPELLAALTDLENDPEVDVIVFARGGGDFTHLLPFSDERLLRAVAAAQKPVVSAIGHEPDNPLLDLVADLRCSTPTGAGKQIVPDVLHEFQNITNNRERIYGFMVNMLNSEARHLDSFRSRPVLATPEKMLEDQQIEIQRWAFRAFELAERKLADASNSVQATRANLRSLSPLETLKRGYAVAQLADGSVLTAPAQAPAGTELHLRLAEGELDATAS